MCRFKQTRYYVRKKEKRWNIARKKECVGISCEEITKEQNIYR
jgi:hypothetical protein